MRRRRATAIPQMLSAVILLAMLALCALPEAFAPADPLKTQPARRFRRHLVNSGLEEHDLSLAAVMA